MRRRDAVVLWPVYFDSVRTRAEGRKVPRRLAKQSPTVGMIEIAVANLGLRHELVSEDAHPHFPWKKTGSVLVAEGRSKGQILKAVAEELLRLSV